MSVCEQAIYVCDGCGREQVADGPVHAHEPPGDWLAVEAYFHASAAEETAPLDYCPSCVSTKIRIPVEKLDAGGES